MDTSSITWLPKTLEVLKNLYEMNPFPYLAMAAWMLFSIWYLRKAFRDYQGINRYLLQMIPFVFTALGLLGAVSGSLGFIWGFTPDDLLSGSEALFKGLLGAATTAIVGIALSLIFGKIVSMTHYKVEMQKALENNELFVLKKMLKLLLKAYAKEQKNVNTTLDALKGVRRDVQRLGPELERNTQQMQTALVAALSGDDDVPLSRKVDELRQELLQHTGLMVRQGQKQGQMLERIAAAIAADDDRSLAAQLTALRDEQRARAAVTEASLGSLYEHVRRINVKEAAASLRTAIQDQTRTFSAELQRHAALLEQHAADRHQDGLELQQALERAAQQQDGRMEALAHSQQAQTAAVAESLHQALQQAEERNAARMDELQQRIGRQAAELASLAALAKALDGDSSEALPARLQELQQQVRSLASGVAGTREALDAGLAEHERLVTATRETLLDELARQQAAAAAQAADEAARRFQQELAPRVETALTRLQKGMETAQQQRDAATDKTVAALRSQQAGQFGGISKQLQELAARVQVSFDRLNQLGSRLDTLAQDTAGVRQFMERAEKTSASTANLARILDKLAPVADSGSLGGNGPGTAVQGLQGLQGLEEAMQQLVSRLRQVDAIKKSDGKFWRQVERQMHDGIPIIMGGNKLDLRDDLNGSFQDRLQRSFNNLDKILQTIVSGYQHRSQ